LFYEQVNDRVAQPNWRGADLAGSFVESSHLLLVNGLTSSYNASSGLVRDRVMARVPANGEVARTESNSDNCRLGTGSKNRVEKIELEEGVVSIHLNRDGHTDHST